MTTKIIQKHVTFDMSFILPLIGSGKALRILSEKYGAKQIKKSWSWRNPFQIDISARVNVEHDVDVDKMREKQHELMMNRRKDE